ncbi:hypothetical protein RN001_008338 [Aquatica leii]|uniref:MADF domain-containing protein n=1 Tax=Aquatica leii TaxID=1421715 RepID=A0AAN7PZ27_9COLE|nr:hypothetical protein RN001_008338 [Aquatica leii]
MTELKIEDEDLYEILEIEPDSTLNDVKYIQTSCCMHNMNYAKYSGLEDLLNSTTTGKIILHSYKKDNKLTAEFRNKLVELIIKVEFENDDDKRITTFKFEDLAAGIVALFPSECKTALPYKHSTAVEVQNYERVDKRRNRKFINLVSKHPCLFDCKNPNYKDARIKENIWKEIAQELNKTNNVSQEKPSSSSVDDESVSSQNKAEESAESEKNNIQQSTDATLSEANTQQGNAIMNTERNIPAPSTAINQQKINKKRPRNSRDDILSYM